MATDHTPPRSQLIVMYGVLSMLVLFALEFVFSGYFTRQRDNQISAKILTEPARELNALRREQTRELKSGAMPINRAMRLFLRDGRSGIALVAPQPSSDPRPLVGWNHYAKKTPPPAVVPLPTAAEMQAANGTPAAAESILASPAVPSPKVTP